MQIRLCVVIFKLAHKSGVEYSENMDSLKQIKTTLQIKRNSKSLVLLHFTIMW